MNCKCWQGRIGGNRFTKCKRTDGHEGPCSDGSYHWTDGELYY